MGQSHQKRPYSDRRLDKIQRAHWRGRCVSKKPLPADRGFADEIGAAKGRQQRGCTPDGPERPLSEHQGQFKGIYALLTFNSFMYLCLIITSGAIQVASYFYPHGETETFAKYGTALGQLSRLPLRQPLSSGHSLSGGCLTS